MCVARTQPRFGTAIGPYGATEPTGDTTGCVHFPPKEDIPLSSAWDVSHAEAAPPSSPSAVWRSPMP